MASGFSSLHPQQKGICEELGIPSRKVTQGYGYAAASAGYHSPEGFAHGRPFSSCFDLSVSVNTSRAPFARLMQAGVVPFLRTAASGWTKLAHIHAVTIGLRDDQGRVTIHSGPRSQILDFLAGRNGLVGHAEMRGPWVPTLPERQSLRTQYEAWAPDIATGVYRGDERLPCYAWYEGGVVRCDVRLLVTALGGQVTWEEATQTPHAFDDQVRELHLTTGRVEVDFWRANVREIAEAFRYGVTFTALEDGSACRVDLRR